MKKFSGQKNGAFALYGERSNKFICCIIAPKPSMKGGHRHRRNWWICPICNKIFKQPWIQNPNIIGGLTAKVVHHMETAHQMPF